MRVSTQHIHTHLIHLHRFLCHSVTFKMQNSETSGHNKKTHGLAKSTTVYSSVTLYPVNAKQNKKRFSEMVLPTLDFLPPYLCGLLTETYLDIFHLRHV